MKIGISELSDLKEKIVKVDEKTAKRYRVVEEVIDLAQLKQEKQGIEEILAMPEPSKDELIELGKGSHSYYWDKTALLKRLEVINNILGVK